jgi:flagellum-specific ATP synthase
MSAQPLDWLGRARPAPGRTPVQPPPPPARPRPDPRRHPAPRGRPDLEAIGCEAPLGATCRVEVADGGWVDAEVVGFAGERSYLMPSAELHGLLPNARVVPQRRRGGVQVGEGLLGRVIDSSGVPLDGRGPVRSETSVSLSGLAINPLSREPITQPLDVGVRAINALLPIGRGQRVGLFAGSGVGKSTLLGMMTRYTAADVIVVGLIGERGREVRDFVESTLRPGGHGARGGRGQSCRPPAAGAPAGRLPRHRHRRMVPRPGPERTAADGLADPLRPGPARDRAVGGRAADHTAAIRRRCSRACRRWSNARGNGAAGRGSITAFYTVLTEGDDPQDPIADAARAILDGHILLSRRVADSGLYPAIDVESSVSRVVTEIADETWRDRIRRLKRLLSAYTSNRDLIAIGAYQKGNDPTVDEALARWPEILEFLGQDVAHAADLPDSRNALERLIERHPLERTET